MKLGYKHNVMIKILSPVAIGNGNAISPLTDFFVDPKDPNYIILIDHDKFEKTLFQKDLMDIFLKQIRSYSDKKKDSFLWGFICNIFKENPLKYTKRRVQVLGYREGEQNHVQISCCIKEREIPYIPGSSLKGAIKSVLLFDYYNQNEYRIDKLMRSIDLHKNKALDEINLFLNKKLPNNRKLFSLLKFSDLYFNSNDYVAIRGGRFRLSEYENINTPVPLAQEAIKINSTAEGTIILENNKIANTKSLDEFKEDNLDSLFKKINCYSKVLLEEENSMIGEDNLNQYSEFNNDLLNLINSADDKYGILPIGGGKMNYYQSIGWFIKQYDKKLFENYIQAFKLGGKHQKTMPVTRTLIGDRTSMGWIIIGPSTIIEEKTLLKNRPPMIFKRESLSDKLEDKDLTQNKSRNIIDESLMDGAVVVELLDLNKQPKVKTEFGKIVILTNSKYLRTESQFQIGVKLWVKPQLNKNGDISHVKYIKVQE